MTYSIFNRDHPGTAEDRVIGAFADAILKLDNSMPTGTYASKAETGKADQDHRPGGEFGDR